MELIPYSMGQAFNGAGISSPSFIRYYLREDITYLEAIYKINQ
jgi:hypothetical protein